MANDNPVQEYNKDDGVHDTNDGNDSVGDRDGDDSDGDDEEDNTGDDTGDDDGGGSGDNGDGGWGNNGGDDRDGGGGDGGGSGGDDVGMVVVEVIEMQTILGGSGNYGASILNVSISRMGIGWKLESKFNLHFQLRLLEPGHSIKGRLKISLR